ncbi:hypothetical protein N7454_008330 [Penicillium verhagenii]|nr:hypothetical protein N7454_008330 [Penicillium verhagenii]
MPQPLIKHLDAYETVTKKAPPPIPSALVIEQRQKINTAGDPFTSLPFNICLEILRELPVPDFYNLRFTSRTMGQFLFKNTFWKTRTNWHDVYCARKEDNTPVRQAAWLRCLYVKELVWQQRQALDLD